MEYSAEVIGGNIKAERNKLGWTQKHLAEELDVVPKQISWYENGKLIPPMEKMLKLCEIFDCRLNDLIGEQGRTSIITIPCEIDSDDIKRKIEAKILPSIQRGLRDEIKAYVAVEAKEILKTMDITEVVENALEKSIKRQITDCLVRVRKDEYEKFYLNGKEVEPSAEKLYNLLASYMGYVKIMEDKKFQKAVIEKAASEAAERIVSSYDKKENYDKIRAIIEGALDAEGSKYQHIQPPTI